MELRCGKESFQRSEGLGNLHLQDLHLQEFIFIDSPGSLQGQGAVPLI